MKLYYVLKNLVKRTTEFEDFTNSVVVNSTFFNTTPGLNGVRARRYGRLCFVEWHLTSKAAVSSASTVKLMTMPFPIQYMLSGMMWYGGAGATRPLLRTDGSDVYQSWTTSIASGVNLDIMLIFLVGGVTKHLINACFKAFSGRRCVA